MDWVELLYNLMAVAYGLGTIGIALLFMRAYGKVLETSVGFYRGLRVTKFEKFMGKVPMWVVHLVMIVFFGSYLYLAGIGSRMLPIYEDFAAFFN